MKKILLTLLLFVSYSPLQAQDIEVKKFEPLEKDQTAVTSPRKDINGTACGLVKVALKELGAEFEGNVMGDVQYTGSEYLVYLPNGTKRLGIKHPDYLPTTVVFANYGTKKISSSTTYELKVKTNKKKAKVDNSKKGMAVFNIKPSNAMLLIDGQIADGSGGAYTLSLPYGTHYYTVKLKDFSINNQVVQIDKNAKNINVDLTEFFAKVAVSCDMDDVSVFIDDELMGNGSWVGGLIPGRHVFEVKKEGFHTQSKTIEVEEGAELSLRFENLKSLTGGIKVDYKPFGSEIYLDGVQIGVTPIERNNISVGEHQLTIKKKSGGEKIITIKVFEDREFFAKVAVSCDMDDVSVFIDDELMGNGSWVGGLIPGRHVFEVKKEGFHTQSKTIEVEEGAELSLRFENLKSLTGGIKVDYKPFGSEIYLDGVQIGVTPIERNNISVGEHQLTIKKKSGGEKNITIKVFEDRTLEVKGYLPMSDIEVLMDEVGIGNGCAMNILGQYYAFDAEITSLIDGPCFECIEELDKEIAEDENARQLWRDASSKSDRERVNEAIKWFGKAITATYRSGHEVGKFYAMLALSECYARLGNYNDSFKWAKKCYDEYKGEGWTTSYYLAWHYYYGKGTESNVSMAKQLLNAVTGYNSKYTAELLKKITERSASPNDLSSYWHFSLSYQQSFGY